MQPDVPVPEQMAAVPGLIGEMLKEQLESLPPPAESLYHYTDAKGLMGILKTNELWATDALYANDRFEIFHGLFVLNQLVKQRGKDSATDPLTAMMTIAGQEFGAIVNTYVMSFCPNRDLLSPWLGYCERRGTVVGYARIHLPQIPEKAVPVRGVTVGPTDNAGLAGMAVFHFQKSLGYPEEMIRVSRPVIPLR